MKKYMKENPTSYDNRVRENFQWEMNKIVYGRGAPRYDDLPAFVRILLQKVTNATKKARELHGHVQVVWGQQNDKKHKATAADLQDLRGDCTSKKARTSWTGAEPKQPAPGEPMIPKAAPSPSSSSRHWVRPCASADVRVTDALQKPPSTTNRHGRWWQPRYRPAKE